MGKHGGINILHQKSWHVWRLDNRLIVERDELKHAAEQREKKKADEQTAFSAKLARLRCRAEGKDEEEAALAQRAFLDAAHAGSSSSSARGAGDPEKNKKKDPKKEASYKYGMVTTSNLKKAEDDLDARLKGSGRFPEAKGKDAAKGKSQGKGKGKGKDHGVREADSLGSGPHINLFEAAEQEQLQHLEEHQKQVGYTQRNNELGGKSKKAMFSEFDEIANDVPWYCKSGSSETLRGRAAEGAGPGTGKPESAPSETQLLGAEHVQRLAVRSRSRSRSKLHRRWKERHGQSVLQMTSPHKLKCKLESESLKDEERLKLETFKEDEEGLKTESCKAEVKLELLKAEDWLRLQRCKAEVKHESLGDEDATAAGISSPEIIAVSARKLIKTEKSDIKEEKKSKKEKKKDKNKQEKAHKKDRKQECKQKEKQELADLRLQRAQREAKERARTAGVLGTR